jgi:hypothetical protein
LACEIRQAGAQPFTRLVFAVLIGYLPPASVAFHPVVLRTTHHRTLPRIAAVAHREQYERQPGPRRPAEPHQRRPAALHSPARFPVRSEVRRQKGCAYRLGVNNRPTRYFRHYQRRLSCRICKPPNSQREGSGVARSVNEIHGRWKPQLHRTATQHAVGAKSIAAIQSTRVQPGNSPQRDHPARNARLGSLLLRTAKAGRRG